MRFSVIGNRPEQLLFETSLKAHEWKLLTVTYSQEHRGRLGTGSASIYLNGLLKETLSFEQSGEIYLGDGWVGGMKPQGHFFDGEIDELRIWSKALSPMEVLTETSGRIRGTTPGLQAYYRFDEVRVVSQSMWPEILPVETRTRRRRERRIARRTAFRHVSTLCSSRAVVHLNSFRLKHP